MHIDHQLIFRRFAHGIVQPGGPLLRTDIHESILDALDTPFLKQRQDLVQLLLQSTSIHIEEDTDILRSSVANHLLQVEWTWGSFRVNGYCCCIGRAFVFVTIPPGIKFDILQTMRCGKVDTGLAADRCERNFSYHFARFDPRRIVNCTWVIQIQQQVVVLQQLPRSIGNHHHTPRRPKRQRAHSLTTQVTDQRVLKPPQRRQLHACIVDQPSFRNSDIETLRIAHHQRAFAPRLELTEKCLFIDPLRRIDFPSRQITGKPKLRLLAFHPKLVEPRLFGHAITERNTRIIRPHIDQPFDRR